MKNEPDIIQIENLFYSEPYNSEKRLFLSVILQALLDVSKNTVTSGDKVNKVMGLYFTQGKSKIWGLQYQPDYEYWQMINLSSARKEKIIGNNHFDNENDFQKHFIQKVNQ